MTTDDLRAEVAALRQDAARWRLVRDAELPDIMDLYHQHPVRFDANVDAAIDAALAAQKD